MAKQLRRNTLTKEDDVLARVEAGVGNAYELVDELADEVERLRKALTKISQSKGEDWDCWWIAEQALNGDDR